MENLKPFLLVFFTPRRLLVGTGVLLAVSAAAFAAAPKVEETILGPTDIGGSYAISPHGAHVAYVGRTEGRLVVTVDGVAGPGFDELYLVQQGIYNFPQNAGVHAATQGGLDQRAVPVVFSVDGEHHAYVGRQGAEYVVIHDGKEIARGPREKLARPLTISPGGKQVYWSESEFTQGRTIVRPVMTGKPGPWFQPVQGLWMPVISPDDSRHAYTLPNTLQSKKQVLIVDGKEAGYPGQQPMFTADSSLLLTVSYEGGNATLLANGKPALPGSVQVSKVVVAPVGRRYAAIIRLLVQNKPVDVLYVDGKQVPGSQHAQDVWFSPDGKRYAAVCHDPFGGPYYMVIDGEAFEFKRISTGPPYWTPDSSKIIFTAGTDSGEVLVVEDDLFPYARSLRGIILPEQGDRYAWGTIGAGNEGHSVIVGKNSVLPPGVYPTSAFMFSPDGSRYGYLVAKFGRSDPSGIVIDGVIQPGIGPSYFGRWLTSQMNALTPLAFSRDGKHVAFMGVTAGARAASMYLDGKVVHPNSGFVHYPTFTPDGQHLFWIAAAPGTKPEATSVVHVDGQPAVRGYAHFFKEIPNTFAVDQNGVATFLAVDGNVAKRYRITPAPDTTIATLLASSTTVVAAAPTAPKTPPPATAAKIPPLAAPPTPKPATATAPTAAGPDAVAAPAQPTRAPEPAKPAAPARPLTWADLVNHPERWPTETKLIVQLKFNSGTLPAGTAVRIEQVTPTGAQLIAPKGFVFDVDQKTSDLLPAANAMWAKLTPEQQALTPNALAGDPTLWPGKVKVIEPTSFGPLKVNAGTELPLIHVKPNEVGLTHPQEKEMLMFAFNYTDVFARARELVRLPPDQRPGRMADSLAGITIDANGTPAAVPKAHYYVFYFAASTCPRCKVFTPKFVAHFNQTLASREDVAFVSWPTEAATPPYLQYARQNSIPWPTIPVERKALFAKLGVFEIPGILVVDRFGRPLLASNKMSGPPLAAAETTLAQLDGVLKPVAKTWVETAPLPPTDPAQADGKTAEQKPAPEPAKDKTTETVEKTKSVLDAVDKTRQLFKRK